MEAMPMREATPKILSEDTASRELRSISILIMAMTISAAKSEGVSAGETALMAMMNNNVGRRLFCDARPTPATMMLKKKPPSTTNVMAMMVDRTGEGWRLQRRLYKGA